MLIFVRDSRNRILSPTTRFSWVKKVLSRNQGKIQHRGKLYVLTLNYPVTSKTRDTQTQYVIGLDSGYKNIGYAVYKVTKTQVIELFAGEVLLRTEQIKELLTERKMYRNIRRHNRRHNSIPNKFRKPRWSNRSYNINGKERFSPTVRHLIQSHENVVEFIFNHIPRERSYINLEYAKFDTQRITGNYNTAGSKSSYTNNKYYVLARDNYTCQSCKVQNIPLEVHHKVQRIHGGSDNPSNLITICKNCHQKHHNHLQRITHVANKALKDTGVLNTAMPSIYKQLSIDVPVYKYFGFETADARKSGNIPKSHVNDARILANFGLNTFEYVSSKIPEMEIIQTRRHSARAACSRLEDRNYKGVNGKYTVASNRNKRTGQAKDSLAELRQNYKFRKVLAIPAKTVYRQEVQDFVPGDLVKNTKTGAIFIVKRNAGGYKVHGHFEGEVSPRQNPKAKKTQNITITLKRNSGLNII